MVSSLPSGRHFSRCSSHSQIQTQAGLPKLSPIGDLRFVGEARPQDQDPKGGVCKMEELRLFSVGDARYLAMPLTKVPLLDSLIQLVANMCTVPPNSWARRWNFRLHHHHLPSQPASAGRVVGAAGWKVVGSRRRVPC